jgi:GGDEF domain-containing protein
VAEALGAELIGEGVEDPADLRMLCELGITYAQGYLLGRPAPAPVFEVSGETRVAMRDQCVQVPPRPQSPLMQHAVKAGHLMIHAPALALSDTVATAEGLFAQHPRLHALAVTDDQRPVGLINRREFTERLAKPFTRELFGRRSCASFMNEAPLLCDEQRSLDSMAVILRGEDQRYLADGFVVTREGRYLGLGTGESLVRRVTELRIDAARHANPLTLLPGNIPVTEHLGRLLESAEPFVAAYVDLTDFKPFNDLYGYFRGDGMIQLLASILTEHVDAHADFVGHIGGDDFLLLMQSANWHERCHRMIEAFGQRSRALFDPLQLERGQLHGKDRHGKRQSFPLTSVTIGAVSLTPPFPSRVEVIARLAARAKRHARRQGVPMHMIRAGGWLPSEQMDRAPA